MDHLIASLSSSGVGGLLVALCVLVSFNLITKVGFLLWSIKANKDKVSEESIRELAKSTERNTKQIEELVKALSELPKLKLDMRRAFIAIREIAGDEWPAIRKEIMEDFSQ